LDECWISILCFSTVDADSVGCLYLFPPQLLELPCERMGVSVSPRSERAFFAQGFREADFDWPQPDPHAAATILEPGSRLAPDVRSNVPEADELRRLLAEIIQQAGLVADPSASTRVVLEANQETRVIRAGPPELVEVLVNCRLAIVDPEGTVAWESKAPLPGPQREEGLLAHWFASRQFPRHLFAKDWQQHIATGRLPDIRVPTDPPRGPSSAAVKQ